MATRAAGELGSTLGTKWGEILRTGCEDAIDTSLVEDMPLPIETPMWSRLCCTA